MLAFFLSLSPYPLSSALVCLLASACSPARRAWDVRANCRFAAAGMETVCLLVPMSSLSRLPARSLFPAQSSSGLPAVVFLLPTHRMSDELVKTARADRSSVKPFQSVAVPYRLRSGCRMMCRLPVPALCVSSPPSCLLAVFSFTSLIRLVPRPVVRVVLRSALSRLIASSRRAYLSGISVSSHPLILPALATPARLALLLLPVPRVGGRGVLVSFSSRHAFRLPSCVFCLPSCVPPILGA